MTGLAQVKLELQIRLSDRAVSDRDLFSKPPLQGSVARIVKGLEQEISVDSPSRVLRDRETLKKPKHLEDYVALAAVFLAEHREPETYDEAVSSIESEEWKRAMQEEIRSLQENNT